VFCLDCFVDSLDHRIEFKVLSDIHGCVQNVELRANAEVGLDELLAASVID